MLLLALSACLTDDWTPPEPVPVVPGPPVVGAAEGFLELPAGTPLGGFTARCTCLLGLSRQDQRDTPYNDAFVPSTGVHTHPWIKVIWIENGDDVLVLTKTDSIYSHDLLVEALEARIGAATGMDLDGRVVHATNHSHSSYGDFSDALLFYLGSDTFNREVFERFADQVAEVAVRAWEAREPASIGLSVVRDWDPDDRIMRDRRGINNDAVFGGDVPLPTGKDPHLVMLRADALDGRPLAAMVNFGMHGIVLDERSPFLSSDSGGGVEAAFAETFDAPVVVMFTQGAGGDQSPAGEQDDFARIESLGARAAPILADVWANTPVSAEPIALRTAARAIPMHRSQIRVTRGGTVDWRYPEEPGVPADDIVYGPDGELLSPLDEFTPANGGVFCGTGFLGYLTGFAEGTEVPPYSTCAPMDGAVSLLDMFFTLDPTDWGLPADAESAVPLPLPDTLRAGAAASVIGPLAIRDPDGSTTTDDVLFSFLPGEATSMYVETYRRRARAELGFEHAVMVSYAMDHEGYLLIPEDWLLGEYEPDITTWGPLGGEHLLEQVLHMTDECLTSDVHVDPDPLGQYLPTRYPERPMPEHTPDDTPDAGTRLGNADLPESFWIPDGFQADFTAPSEVPRVQGIVWLAWKGGDPAVDSPRVFLEREVAGSWEPATTHAGRPITSSLHDMLMGWTPDPLRPHTDPQDHLWWVSWQAVAHVRERTGLPLGTYRLRVAGQRFVGEETAWPYSTEPYEVLSDPFDVVPATLDVQLGGPGLTVSLPGPASGWRYLAAGGNARGDNAVAGDLTVTWDTPAGPVVEDVTGVPSGGRTGLAVTAPIDATAVTVTDTHGNSGTLVLTVP